MQSTSPSLLLRLRDGTDVAAWNRFVDLYTPLLMRWCLRLGLSEADAADFTQDVFVQMLKTLPYFTYNPTQSFRAWLKTVLMNAWRKQQRHLARIPHQNGDASQAASPDPGQFVDEAEYRDFLVRRVLAIAQVDFEPTTWLACREFVMNGRPAEEVARELGLSVNAVYLAKSRVLRHLRSELAGLLD
jgi:RNA polymerase sigma-70 factor (ECF subfamily)